MKKQTKQSRNRNGLVIRELCVSLDGRPIVRNASLTIRPGEIHALIGPNGSGKSTLLHALAGHPRAIITKGSIILDRTPLKTLPPHVRAQKGLFLGFQQPVDVAGVTLAAFLRNAKNALAPFRNATPLSPTAFASSLAETLRTLGMDERFGGRQVNAGFSGGEKKRSEILQMVVLKPRYALLDEFDSGLDVDAVQQVARVIVAQAHAGVGFLLVSHNPKLADVLPLDAVHVMRQGTMMMSGGKEILSRVEGEGYVFLENQNE